MSSTGRFGTEIVDLRNTVGRAVFYTARHGYGHLTEEGGVRAHRVALYVDRIAIDRGIAGSGCWAWLRSPELDQVGVRVEEVGSNALGRVHVPGPLRAHRD